MSSAGATRCFSIYRSLLPPTRAVRCCVIIEGRWLMWQFTEQVEGLWHSKSTDYWHWSQLDERVWPDRHFDLWVQRRPQYHKGSHSWFTVSDSKLGCSRYILAWKPVSWAPFKEVPGFSIITRIDDDVGTGGNKYRCCEPPSGGLGFHAVVAADGERWCATR